jgi:hypothetical protein
MPTVAFCLPILPGQTESFRAFSRRFAVERRAEFEASRRRQGVTVERSFLQRTPGGDVAIVILEANDPARMFAEVAGSTESLDVDFRAYLRQTFGIDLSATPPAIAEPIFDWRA